MKKDKKKSQRQKILDFLKLYEGFNSTVYKDGRGRNTIGYGFTDPSLIAKGKMSRAEADVILDREVSKREQQLKSKIKDWNKLSDDSKTALLSYYYNYPAGFDDTTRFIRNWNAGNYDAAVREIDAGMNDTANAGLKDRRLAELALLRTDPYLFGILTTKTNDGKKMTFPLPNWAANQAQIPNPWMPKLIDTDYALDTTTPDYLNPFNGADSPAYGGTSPRIKGIQEINNRRQAEMFDLFENAAVSYGRKPDPFVPPTVPELLSEGKTGWFKNIMGAPSLYDEDDSGNGMLIRKFLIPDRFKFGKDLPHFNPGKDSKQIERGGVVYNVDPSAIGASELDVTVPNTTVRSRFGAKESYDKEMDKFRSRYLFGYGHPPVDPGLELIYPEFDILSLMGGLGNLGKASNSTNFRAVRGTQNHFINTVQARDFNAARRALANRFEPEQLTGSSTAKDIAKYYGINHNLYPLSVTESLENSVYPRMREMRSWLTDNQFNSAVKYAADGKYTAYPKKTFDTANGVDSRITASYYPDTDHIAVRAGRITDDLGHEIEHKLDEAIPLTEQEDKLLSNAYDDDFIKLFDKSERKTLNYDARRKLLGKFDDRKVPITKLNEIIDGKSDEQIFEAVAKANGYGQDYMEAKREAGKLTVELANAIREAMKKVGAYSAPTVGGATLYNSMQNSGILPKHNRGRNLPRYGGART